MPRGRASFGHGSPRPAGGRSYAVQQLDEVKEIRRLPQEVKKNQATARRRVDDLREIFVSRHADKCKELRERLLTLDGEAKMLQGQINTLEDEVEIASAERTARNTEVTGAAVAAMKSSAAVPDPPMSIPIPFGADAKADTIDEEGEACIKEELPEQLGVEKASAAPSRSTIFHIQNMPQTSTTDPSEVQAMSPRLNRRFVESRARDAEKVHMSAMAKMQLELGVMDRRKRKQEVWVKNVNKQILQAEIHKTTYSARLQMAERRIQALSKDLSQAYVNLNRLLEERVAVEDTVSHNKALVTYLDEIGREDANNEANFEDNSVALRKLKERYRVRDTEAVQLEELLADAHARREVVPEILEQVENLRTVLNGLNQIWSKVPTAAKDQAIAHLPKGSSLLPATAIQHIIAETAILAEGERNYVNLLLDMEKENRLTGWT